MSVVITTQIDGAPPPTDKFAIEYQGAVGSPWRLAKVVRKAAGQYVAEFPTPFA